MLYSAMVRNALLMLWWYVAMGGTQCSAGAMVRYAMLCQCYGEVRSADRFVIVPANARGW